MSALMVLCFQGEMCVSAVTEVFCFVSICSASLGCEVPRVSVLQVCELSASSVIVYNNGSATRLHAHLKVLLLISVGYL